MGGWRSPTGVEKRGLTVPPENAFHGFEFQLCAEVPDVPRRFPAGQFVPHPPKPSQGAWVGFGNPLGALGEKFITETKVMAEHAARQAPRGFHPSHEVVVREFRYLHHHAGTEVAHVGREPGLAVARLCFAPNWFGSGHAGRKAPGD